MLRAPNLLIFLVLLAAAIRGEPGGKAVLSLDRARLHIECAGITVNRSVSPTTLYTSKTNTNYCAAL